MSDESQIAQFNVNGISFEFDQKTLALMSLKCGDRTWLDNSPKGESCWMIHIADEIGRRLDLDCSHARSASARMDGQTLHLAWQGVGDPKAETGDFNVTVEIKPSEAGPNLTAWRLNIENNSPGYTIWHFHFPRLVGLKAQRDPAAEQVFWPEFWGMQTTGWDDMVEVYGPCGGYGKQAMQFMGFTRDNRTLYFASHDTAYWPKEMTFTPIVKEGEKPRQAKMHFLSHPEGMTQAGNSYRQNYDIVVGEVDGDWFDASKIYARWARRQPWASKPPANTFTGCREEREVLVWQQASMNKFPQETIETINSKPPAEWKAEMKELRKRLGVRVAVHLYHWHQTQFDTNYPDYCPAKDGFKEFVAEMQEAGVIIMPYINGRIWDINAPTFDDTACAHAVKHSAERANPHRLFLSYENYGNGQRFARMCMHTGFWESKLVDLCKWITKELGCGGIYIDQLGCTPPCACHDPAHGHPLGGGEYWLAGCRKLMQAIRNEIGPDTILTTENNWEACVADFDALLDTNWDKENNLPIFPAVYWGLNSIFGGSNIGRIKKDGGEGFAQSAGMRFAWGGQAGWGHFEPLLLEENRDLYDYFSALCQLRTQYGRFFCRGEFLRPPVLKTATGEKITNPLKGPVLAGMWSDPDAPGAAIFLVNVTRKEIEVSVEITDAAWLQSEPLHVTLPPLGSLALPVNKA